MYAYDVRTYVVVYQTTLPGTKYTALVVLNKTTAAVKSTEKTNKNKI